MVGVLKKIFIVVIVLAVLAWAYLVVAAGYNKDQAERIMVIRMASGEVGVVISAGGETKPCVLQVNWVRVSNKCGSALKNNLIVFDNDGLGKSIYLVRLGSNWRLAYDATVKDLTGHQQSELIYGQMIDGRGRNLYGWLEFKTEKGIVAMATNSLGFFMGRLKLSEVSRVEAFSYEDKKMIDPDLVDNNQKIEIKL